MKNKFSSQRGNVSNLVLVLGGIGVIAWLVFGGNSSDESNTYENNYTYPSSYSADFYSNSYSDEYEYENEEYSSVGFSGTDTMYACNQNSGNCYDLEVDSDGESIERLNFDNGGWVDVDSSDCDGGYCYVEDENGTEWELEY